MANVVVNESARAREVVDALGAGDAVIAALEVAVAAGDEWEVAVRAANPAGGKVVGNSGTAVVMREELRLAMADNVAVESTRE